MNVAKVWRGVQVLLVLVGGASFGLGASTIHFKDFPLVVSLMVISGFSEWLEVKLQPIGAFTLRPVTALLALWSLGVGPAMVVGLAPLVIVSALKRSSLLPDVLASSGRDALGIWAATLLLVGAESVGVSSGPHGQVAEVGLRAGSFLVFWVVFSLINGIGFHLSEGIKFPVAITHLVRQSALHVVVLATVSVALGYVLSSFGIGVTFIAAIVLIEAYYPWKLLGDQSGVLLTSLQMMAQAVDLKDPYTSNHSQRVSAYAVRIARALSIPEDEVERIRVGGLMHDIGKIGISGRIIRKPGRLTAEEKALMDLHSSISADIIEPLDILGESARMVRHHHEHRDGSGYPDGLKGEEIPLGSRIILVADAFDALTTDRPYRKGVPRSKAVAVIRESAGMQFDPVVVDALERIAATL